MHEAGAGSSRRDDRRLGVYQEPQSPLSAAELASHLQLQNWQVQAISCRAGKPAAAMRPRATTAVAHAAKPSGPGPRHICFSSL